MRVALDMDGVIANFTKQGCKVMGEPYPSNYIFKNYSWIFDKHGKPSCYKRMRGHHFWISIEKFPWTDQLIDLVDTETKGNWFFLTKPMVDPYCYSGKAEWLMKHRREFLNKLVICAPPKAHFATKEKDVLIDDKIENCNDWKAAGGTPFFWEELSDDYDPEYIKERLKTLKEFLQQIKSK